VVPPLLHSISDGHATPSFYFGGQARQRRAGLDRSALGPEKSRCCKPAGRRRVENYTLPSFYPGGQAHQRRAGLDRSALEPDRALIKCPVDIFDYRARIYFLYNYLSTCQLNRYPNFKPLYFFRTSTKIFS
ncbi:MAG: hypothetical protein WBN55_07985, partial [Eudoraea sp.]|uniref:hypothetical protein n=1 Tax=Eudoraea sp. TaxID=1979955 RepID=UPI003C73B8D5